MGKGVPPNSHKRKVTEPDLKVASLAKEPLREHTIKHKIRSHVVGESSMEPSSKSSSPSLKFLIYKPGLEIQHSRNAM